MSKNRLTTRKDLPVYGLTQTLNVSNELNISSEAR